jgi:short-subunit dehydrogenase
MKLAHKKVLLTGASGGIGSAIAERLAQDGAHLTLIGRDIQKLDQLACRLKAAGSGDVLTLPGDLGEPHDITRLVGEAITFAGGLDVLINCAGVQNFGFFAEEGSAATARLFHINAVAPMQLVQAVLPHMLRRGSGRIVNVGSIFGSIGYPCFASYSASKFALRGFSEALRRELAGSGVDVTYVAPRFTRTAFNSSWVNRMADVLKMHQDTPAQVAAQVVEAIAHGERERYLGWPEKFFVRLNALLPRLVDRALEKQVEHIRPFACESHS